MRLAYGTYKNLTEKQKKEHKRQLSKEYRDKNNTYLKARNKYYYSIYKQTRPHTLICQNCGREFGCYNKVLKKCPECIELNKNTNIQKRLDVDNRKKQRIEKINQIIDLYKKGISQVEISKIVNMPQPTISMLLVRKGYRSRPYNNRNKGVDR